MAIQTATTAFDQATYEDAEVAERDGRHDAWYGLPLAESRQRDAGYAAYRHGYLTVKTLMAPLSDDEQQRLRERCVGWFAHTRRDGAA